MKLYEAMNDYLANLEVFYMKLHNLHWYVKGKSFFTLHVQFENMFDETAGYMDEVAERLLALGEDPIANMSEAVKRSTIKERADEDISSQDAVNTLIDDVRKFVELSNEMIDIASEAGDAGTEDIFTGLVQAYQKHLWMLESYLEEV